MLGNGFKVSGLVLAMSSMLGSSVFAYLPPISFEGTEFVPMTLVHHQSGGKYAGWELIDGTARVSAVGDGFNGGKALEIPADPLVQAHIRREIPWETNEPIAFIDLRVKPAANPEGSEAGFYANGSQFAFQKSSGGTTGEIWVYDGNDGAVDSANDPEEWLEAPASFVLDSAGTSSADYIRITMRQDEIREVWDLFVNGQLAAANLRFDGREELLDAIHFFGGGQNAGDTLIDDLSADPDNMLFPDNDKDGLPNDWETANGSDPNLYDRDNISPNGKSWLERYVDSLWTAGKGAYGGPGQGSNGGGSIPPLNILELHEPVGALKGSLSVAGDGSASYTIPVDVPKGTAGMEPQISLNYSSNMPNGIAGLGWTVSGLQQITRGAATLQKDGFVDGVDFDGNDRFFFNGERLVCVAGTYGASGSEYRTEIDSFARITAIGTSGSGPLSWKVETKAGLVLSLGASSNSRVMVGTKGVLSWSVDKVEDTVGNYYAVSYESSPPIRTGEVRNYRVARIDYTGSATLAPYASISFEFEARPDVQSFYTAGLRQSFDERLKAIRVETGSYWNHSYELSYVSSEQTGRSLLTAVRKKGPSGSIPETTFRWQTVGHDDPKWREAGVLETQSYLIENEPGDESGSVAEVSPDSEHTLHLSGNAWRGVASPYVVTSDTWLEFEVRTDPEPGLLMIGLDDDLQSTDPGRLFTLVGAEPEAAGSDLYSSSGSWERKRIHVGQHYTGATNYLVLVNDCRAAGTSNGESWFRNVKLYEGDTDPFTVAPISFGFAAGIPTLTSNSDVNYGYEMADFDGDGFTDLLRASYTGKTQVGSYYELGSTVEAWKGGPAGLSSMTPPQHPFPVMTHMANAYWNMDGERHGYIHPFTDLDGDGVVDAGYSREISLPAYNTYSSTHSFAHFDGTGWAEDATFRLPFESRSMGNWFRFDYFDHPDVNGDGSPDCIVDLQLGWLLDPDNGSSITPAAGKYGLVWLNQIQGSGDWERKESYDIPVPLDSAMIGKRFLDVNSDGLPDLVRKTSASDKWVWINTGSSWALEPADSRFQLPEVVSNNGGADMGTRIVDLNGDGHPDFINKWKYGGYPAYDTRVHLGTGDGWDTFSEGAAGPWDLPVAFTTFDKSWTSHSSRSSLVDINADGLVDLVDSKASRNMIYFNTGDGWWESDSGTYWADGSSTSSGGYGLPVPAFRDAWAEYYGWNSGVFLDLNGDGVTDYVSHSETADPKVWINLRGPEFIEAVTDGYDKTLTIEYSRLNDPAPLALTDRRAYTPYDPVVDPLLASGHIGVRNGGYVVTRLIEPDGLGGMKCSRRHYGDLRFDRINQSSLGFGWIEVHDELCLNSGSIISRGYTRTEMSRSYPFAGSPLVVDVFVHIADPIPSQLVGVSAGTKHVSRETSIYAKPDDEIGVAGGSVKRPVQTGSIVTRWDINDGETKLSEVTTTQDLANFDAYGFVRISTVMALDGTTTQTENVYSHKADGGKWLLGRLCSSKVQKTGSTISLKTTGFAYDTDTGLLVKEVVEPTSVPATGTEPSLGSYDPSPKPPSAGFPGGVETTYTHDDFGNVKDTYIKAYTSGGAQATRRTKVWHGDDGRFPRTETAYMGTAIVHGTVTHTYDEEKALLISTKDIDDLTTNFEYDSFGTQIATNLPDGTSAAEITRFASNSDLPAPVASKLTSAVKWARVSQSSGTPWATVYLDSIGREIATETTIMSAFNGSSATYRDVYTVTRYDARGRKTSASQPFFAGDPPMWTSLTYDSVDRVLTTTHPDGTCDCILSIKSIQNGDDPRVEATISNAGGQQLTRWENQHGRMVQSTDASNQLTTFHHDVEGNVTSVDIDGLTQITNTFEIYGNKIAVDDLSAGVSSTAFDGFGQVLSVTNALSQTTTTVYDLLGRVETVTRPGGIGGEGEFYYGYYDTSPNKGKPYYVWGYAANDYQHEIYYFDAYGRPNGTETYRYGENFTTSTTYNVLGLPTSTTDAGALVINTEYDTSYPVFKVRSKLPATNTTLWEPRQFDAQGREVSSKLAHGVETARTPNPANGTLTSVFTTGPPSMGGALLQNLAYVWESNGNLQSRIDNVASRTESFTYDSLNRLKSSTVLGSGTTDYTYDSNGNLKTRITNGVNLASLTYQENGTGESPYRVASARVKTQDSNPNRNYGYDASGRVTTDTRRGYGWTSFGQLKSIVQNSAPSLQSLAQTNTYLASGVPGIPPQTFFNLTTATSTFEFDAAGNRARQELRRVNSGQLKGCTTLYLGTYERETFYEGPELGPFSTTRTVKRHHLGSAIYTVEVKPGQPALTRLSVLLSDHLGSTDVILCADRSTGNWTNFRAERQSFTPWGERRDGDTWVNFRSNDTDNYRTSSADCDRGYTGHEMLDDFGIIHMNGRIYDPEIGRMLGPDPFVQMPEFSQNFNRYSYVLNNPLNLTDPTGFSWLSDNWKTLVVIVVAVVVAVVTYGAASGWATSLVSAVSTGVNLSAAAITATTYAISGAIVGFSTGAVGAALDGGDVGDILRGAAVGGVSGALSGAAGALGGVAGAAARAGVAGASSAAMGGKFQDGFISSLAISVFNPVPIQAGDKFAQILPKVLVAGAVGGSASALGGGKFANGAYTATFQYLVSNAVSPSYSGDAAYDKAAARYSEQVYLDSDGGALKDIGITSYKNNDSGFGAALYGSASSGYYLAFRGTNFFSANDWVANTLQAFGIRTNQYDSAVKLALEVHSRTGGNVTFVGHSLGGGLASAAAGATRGRAVTFNAAGVSSTYRGSPDRITANYIGGDILSVGQDFSPLANAAGERIGFSGWSGPIHRHFIRQFNSYRGNGL